MGLFNFFGESEHKVFDYKPIYYNKEDEERRKMFGAVDGSLEKSKKDGSYAPGSYIQGAFRDGAYQRTRTHNTRTQTIIGIVSMILIFAVLFFIAKFYSLL
ncbi:MAG: hypothetical protein MJY41_03260 [Bacteroidales bacterium]|nr:hypothetical protein [Bacteroidales bacterium]